MACFVHFDLECASRHNGVHFFDISTSKSAPMLVCFVHFDLEMCFGTTACTFSTSQLPKVVREWRALTLLTWKCASRHNGVHFFDISTSKSAPRMACFVHFDLEMCFVPQRRALFRHLNFQKCSDVGVFCTFWLGNVLRATTACTFSTSQLPKVVQEWRALYILTWKCASPQRHALFRHLNFQKCSENGVLCTFWLGNVLRATTAYTLSTSQLPKVVREWRALTILTWKCASRHNGVHFFDISTSKSAPRMACFVHFDLEMCFVPQRRALFRQLNFQKCSDVGVFCTFWLGNVLRATTARPPLISHLASWLRTRRFSEATFRPSGALIWKTQWIATFLPFPTPASSLFWLSPSLIFSLLDFSSLTLPTSASSAFPSLRKFDF